MGNIAQLCQAFVHSSRGEHLMRNRACQKTFGSSLPAPCGACAHIVSVCGGWEIDRKPSEHVTDKRRCAANGRCGSEETKNISKSSRLEPVWRKCAHGGCKRARGAQEAWHRQMLQPCTRPESLPMLPSVRNGMPHLRLRQDPNGLDGCIYWLSCAPRFRGDWCFDMRAAAVLHAACT